MDVPRNFVYVGNFTKAEYEICQSCPISKKEYYKLICPIAVIACGHGGIPEVEELNREQIEVKNLPKLCPNRYYQYFEALGEN